MKNTHSCLVAVGFVALAGCSGAPAPGENEPSSTLGTTESALTSTEVKFPVSIRTTGSATLAGHVYTNPNIKFGLNVLAVPGVAETGTVFGPLAQTVFSDSILKFVVKSFVGLDFPLRGDSTAPTGLPAGVKYGDLTIEDDASMVVQAVDALKGKGLPVTAILGHSLGGLDVLVAQQQLLGAGSSFLAHGVVAVDLFSPVPPQPVPWTPPPGTPPGVVNDPTLGVYLNLAPAVWIPVAFTDTTGNIAADAPTVAQVTAAGYVGPEPVGDLAELGSPSRPTMNPGIFSPIHGTILKVVGFSQDTVVQATFMKQLYELATGDTHDILLRQVTAADAVHAMLVSNPAGLVSALEPSF